jgi:hypothetical protein
MELNESAQTEPTETLQAISARVWKIEEAFDAGDVQKVRRGLSRLIRILPEPTKRHLEAAEGEL